MDKPKDVDSYIAQADIDWQDSLRAMREVLLETEMEETIKWAFPVYTLNKKNVVGLFVSKSYAGIWFYQGALLNDPEGRLVAGSEGKTIAQRQLRFPTPADVDLDLMRAFLAEAIENQRMGLTIKPQSKGELVIPDELQQYFAQHPDVATAFAQFTPYKQREFCEHIAEAKRAATKESRLAKIAPMILEGIGLSDKYRK